MSVTNSCINLCAFKDKKKSKNLQRINRGERVEKTEHSYTAGGSINWCSHSGEEYGVSLKT